MSSKIYSHIFLKGEDFVKQKIGRGLILSVYNLGKWRTEVFGGFKGKSLDYQNLYFDLASLTKTLTASQYMHLAQAKKLYLNQKTYNFLKCLKPFKNLTIQKLLSHQSGLDLIQKYSKDKNYTSQKIQKILFGVGNLEIQNTSSRFNYSDLNYIYLGEILPKLTGSKTLESSMNDFFQKNGLNFVFNPISKGIPTSQIVSSSKYLPVGTVHDPKTRWLGGVAGSAGLFGSLSDLQKFTQLWLENSFGLSSELYKTSLYPEGPWYFSYNKPIFGTVWRLGKYSPNPNHAGFTGPSILLDPINQRAIVHLNNYLFESESEENRGKFLSWNKDILESF